MEFIVPLKPEQIAAAKHLRERLDQWNLIDEALRSLATHFPDHSPCSTLLKVTTLNRLYSTGVFDVMGMAEHVRQVMATGLHQEDPITFVERLATFRSEKPRFWVFGSKFAHFFINAEEHPILDSYAERMIGYHLGPESDDGGGRYRTYVTRIRRLAALIPHNGPARELDFYLWIAGEHQAWENDGKEDINGELKALFMDPSPDVQREIAVLRGRP